MVSYPPHPSQYTAVVQPQVYVHTYPTAHIRNPMHYYSPQHVYINPTPYDGNMVTVRGMGQPSNTASHYQQRRENLTNKCEETYLKCDSKSERFLNATSRESRYDSADSGISEPTSSVTSSWDCDDTSSDSSNENGRNLLQESGWKCENGDGEHYWTIRDDDQYWAIVGQQVPGYYVTNAIAKQIEYYLSDDYLMKDKYLLRQIRCKKDGYVSIKLITSFKKVKKLTRDWAVVRSAIVRLSTTVVVSSEGLRIRRRANLSENLRKPRQLTSVLAIRLPSEYNSVEKVTSLFALFGEIGFVRLLRSDKEVPCDLRNYATQVHDIGKSLCAVVDFDQSEDALASVRILKHLLRSNEDYDVIKEQENINEDQLDKYKQGIKDLSSLTGTRVALLGPRVRRTLYRQDRTHDVTNFPGDGEVPCPVKDNRELKVDYDVTSKIDVTSKSSRGPRLCARRITGALLRHNSCIVTRQPRGPDHASRGFSTIVTRI
ncbi:uncharacterized protein LOC100175449 [Ciona intestinalis]